MTRSPGLTASGSHPRLARRGLRPGFSPAPRAQRASPRVLTRASRAEGFAPGLHPTLGFGFSPCLGSSPAGSHPARPSPAPVPAGPSDTQPYADRGIGGSPFRVQHVSIQSRAISPLVATDGTAGLRAPHSSCAQCADCMFHVRFFLISRPSHPDWQHQDVAHSSDVSTCARWAEHYNLHAVLHDMTDMGMQGFRFECVQSCCTNTLHANHGVLRLSSSSP